MSKVAKLYGWKLSYFTGKMYCYLKYKNIPFKEKLMNVYDLQYSAYKKTGAKVMPILVTPEGEWIQDSREIINQMEIKFPPSSNANHHIFPSTPKKRLASLLFEAWGDEFWIPIAMHYRWNYSESVEFFKKEAMNNLLPPPISYVVPKFVKDNVTSQICNVLIGFLPSVGVRPNQYQMIEEWTVDMCTKLNHHFSIHPYILGSYPTVGDFSLAGPFVAHLARDPGPKAVLFGIRDGAVDAQQYPHLYAWTIRMQTQSYLDIDKSIALVNNTVENDEVPVTLEPIIQSILLEFIPMLEQSLEIMKNVSIPPPRDKPHKIPFLPRVLSDIQFPILGNKHMYARKAIAFNVYKMQTLLTDMKQYIDENSTHRSVLYEYIDALIPPDKTDVGRMMSDRVFNMGIPPLERVGLRVRFTNK